MEPELPFEFVVMGTPVSLQGSARTLLAWKAAVGNAARRALPEGSWLLARPLSVRIFILSDGRMQGDLDNRLKPILDAMVRCVYAHDDLLERIVVQRFERQPQTLLTLETLSPVLLAALEADGPMVYVRVTDNLFEDFT